MRLYEPTMIQSENRIWFPEPDVEDDSIARKDEGWFGWVMRATSEKGKACRAFLNAQLSRIPANWQPKLYHDLRSREWESVLFELIGDERCRSWELHSKLRLRWP